MINFPDIKYLGEYYHYIVGLFDRSGIVSNRTSLNKSVRTRSPAILEAKIFAPGVSGYPDETALPFDEINGIVLTDGSFLRFDETVRVSRRRGTDILAYSYHYQRPNENFFIRFDFEELPTPDQIRKPQYHVHTSAKPEIHIPCIPIDLDRVLQFIKANFIA